MRKGLRIIALSAALTTAGGIETTQVAWTFPALPPQPVCGAVCTNEGAEAMCPDYMSEPWSIGSCTCHNGRWACPGV